MKLKYKVKCGTKEGKEEVTFYDSFKKAVDAARKISKENDRTAYVYTESFGGWKLSAKIGMNIGPERNYF